MWSWTASRDTKMEFGQSPAQARQARWDYHIVLSCWLSIESCLVLQDEASGLSCTGLLKVWLACVGLCVWRRRRLVESNTWCMSACCTSSRRPYCVCCVLQWPKYRFSRRMNTPADLSCAYASPDHVCSFCQPHLLLCVSCGVWSYAGDF